MWKRFQFYLYLYQHLFSLSIGFALFYVMAKLRHIFCADCRSACEQPNAGPLLPRKKAAPRLGKASGCRKAEKLPATKRCGRSACLCGYEIRRFQITRSDCGTALRLGRAEFRRFQRELPLRWRRVWTRPPRRRPDLLRLGRRRRDSLAGPVLRRERPGRGRGRIMV